MFRILTLFIFIAAVVAANQYWLANRSTPAPQPAPPTVLYSKRIQSILTAKCVRILDGDTIEVYDGTNPKFKVRLESIDAPETKQPFGDRAKQAVGELAHEKQVTIFKTGEDRWGRTLGFIEVGGVNLSALMLENGLAWHYKEYSSDPELAAKEDQARKSRLNIWSDATAVAPWEWRNR